MIRKYRHGERQTEFDFEEKQPDANPDFEPVVDEGAFKKFRNFSPDSIFEQQNRSQKNMAAIMSGESKGIAVDWKNEEQVDALIADLRRLEPKELLKRALALGITSIPEEDSAWYHARNVLLRDSGDPHNGGTKWSMGQKAHLEFVDTNRRPYFIMVASETLGRGAENPMETLGQLREETREALRQAGALLKSRKPR